MKFVELKAKSQQEPYIINLSMIVYYHSTPSGKYTVIKFSNDQVVTFDILYSDLKQLIEAEIK